MFRVLRVSGTMRKAEEEAIRRARREIVRMRRGEEVGVLGGLVGAVGAGAGAEAVVDDEERAMDDVGVLEDEEEDVESMSE